MSIYHHMRHPHISRRHAHGPVRHADIRLRGSVINRFNTRIALLVTRAVGSMWCAYAFALFDMISLPAAIRGGVSDVVTWVAQTFMQLVLLSVIMVGQNVQSVAADRRAEATFHDTTATLHEVEHIQGHLAAQDVLLTRIAEKLGLDPVPVTHAPPSEELNGQGLTGQEITASRPLSPSGALACHAINGRDGGVISPRRISSYGYKLGI